ncbi:MAG: SGNH/GDSL hydrolase family protein, partial [Myxococcota bacterium]|nr:SGNH/GDSL hydrolase family protein [Myxococcota bacterium]
AAFPEKTQELVDRYLALLAEYARESRTAGAKPVLIYFPAYPQVYAPGTPLLIRDVLQEEAALLNIPFLDLTATFRQRGAAHVLHMAPLDYHLNPAGNQVFAEAVFEFLLDRNMVR